MRLLLPVVIVGLSSAVSNVTFWGAPRLSLGSTLPNKDDDGHLAKQILELGDTSLVSNTPKCGNNSGTASARSIAYYQAWNVRTRPCDKVWPDQIKIEGLTHLNLAFAWIDPGSFKIKLQNPADEDIYRKFVKLKRDGLQTWLSVGGWEFSDEGETRATWSNMVGTQNNRHIFISSVLELIENYGFQGLDLDWEWPGATNRGGRAEDKGNYVELTKELHEAFTNKKYGLTCALPQDYAYLQNIDIKSMSQYVDWFNVLTYDLHGSWDSGGPELGRKIRSHTDLKEIDEHIVALWNTGVGPEKFTFGLAYYGRGYTTSERNCLNIGCGFSGPSKRGNCSQQEGVLTNCEIRRLIRTERANSSTIAGGAGAKQLFWEDQWIGYDDFETIAMKKNFANDRCMGGTAIWGIDYDSCDEGWSSVGPGIPNPERSSAQPSAPTSTQISSVSSIETSLSSERPKSKPLPTLSSPAFRSSSEPPSELPSSPQSSSTDALVPSISQHTNIPPIPTEAPIASISSTMGHLPWLPGQSSSIPQSPVPSKTTTPGSSTQGTVIPSSTENTSEMRQSVSDSSGAQFSSQSQSSASKSITELFRSETITVTTGYTVTESTSGSTISWSTKPYGITIPIPVPVVTQISSPLTGPSVVPITRTHSGNLSIPIPALANSSKTVRTSSGSSSLGTIASQITSFPGTPSSNITSVFKSDGGQNSTINSVPTPVPALMVTAAYPCSWNKEGMQCVPQQTDMPCPLDTIWKNAAGQCVPCIWKSGICEPKDEPEPPDCPEHFIWSDYRALCVPCVYTDDVCYPEPAADCPEDAVWDDSIFRCRRCDWENDGTICKPREPKDCNPPLSWDWLRGECFTSPCKENFVWSYPLGMCLSCTFDQERNSCIPRAMEKCKGTDYWDPDEGKCVASAARGCLSGNWMFDFVYGGCRSCNPDGEGCVPPKPGPCKRKNIFDVILGKCRECIWNVFFNRCEIDWDEINPPPCYTEEGWDDCIPWPVHIKPRFETIDGILAWGPKPTGKPIKLPKPPKKPRLPKLPNPKPKGPKRPGPKPNPKPNPGPKPTNGPDPNPPKKPDPKPNPSSNPDINPNPSIVPNPSKTPILSRTATSNMASNTPATNSAGITTPPGTAEPTIGLSKCPDGSEPKLFGCGCGYEGMSFGPGCPTPTIEQSWDIDECGIFGCDNCIVWGDCPPDRTQPPLIGISGYCPMAAGCSKCPKELCPTNSRCPQGCGPKTGKPPENPTNCAKTDLTVVTRAITSCLDFPPTPIPSINATTTISSTCKEIFRATVTGCRPLLGTTTTTRTSTSRGGVCTLAPLMFDDDEGDNEGLLSTNSTKPVAACTLAPLSLDDDEGDNEGLPPAYESISKSMFRSSSFSSSSTSSSSSLSPSYSSNRVPTPTPQPTPSLSPSSSASYSSIKIPTPTPKPMPPSPSSYPSSLSTSSTETAPTETKKPQQPIQNGGIWMIEISQKSRLRDKWGWFRWRLIDSNGNEANSGEGDARNKHSIGSHNRPDKDSLPYTIDITVDNPGEARICRVNFAMNAGLPNGCRVSWDSGGGKTPCIKEGYPAINFGCNGGLMDQGWRVDMREDYSHRNFTCFFKYLGNGGDYAPQKRRRWLDGISAYLR